ncbi:alpha-mannosidase 2c1 [candidate division KSB1 bacterium]|nr:alpha-mannosidase 2c1 [candidate division KSB1 bacterium]
MNQKEYRFYSERIDQFVQALPHFIYQESVPLQGRYALFEPMLPFSQRLEKEFKPINIGDSWGENWQTAWFHLEGYVPKAWKNNPVVARINIGGEALVFLPTGEAVESLSNHSIFSDHFTKDRLHIAHSAEGDEHVELWLEATAAEILGLCQSPDPDEQDPRREGHYTARVRHMELALFRQDIWQLYLDAMVLFSQTKVLPKTSVRHAHLFRNLNQAVDMFAPDQERVEKTRELLQPYLQEKTSPAYELSTRAIGHAHIDTQWLWPLDETIRKCARTFANQLSLIKRYSGYVFGASQPQHYQFVKDHYPEIYRRVVKAVAQGRWELQGGMWVEADCNLIDGESMVRQILYGKQFFKKEFGVNVRNLWLPDVFGYSAALPQIMKKSGLSVLVTQKISWNQFNRFPHHTFRWQGIDGSEVITHFPPEDDYNSALRPETLVHAQNNFAEKAFLDEFLTLYGIGDGGGGPTEDILETGLRQHDMAGSPRVQFGPAQEMLDRLLPKDSTLPLWAGELYLELHRGTLTTQAYNKKMNRRLELLMRQIEFIYSMLPAEKYPMETIERMWKKILLNQFHDIIPGSGIKRVYEISRQHYQELDKEARELIQQASSAMIEPDSNTLSWFNSLSVSYRRPLSLPKSWGEHEILDSESKPLPVQVTEHGVYTQIDIPPLSFVSVFRGKKIAREMTALQQRSYVLENEWIRYEFNPYGQLVKIWDREFNFSYVQPGQRGNILSLYNDQPVKWDAWDVDIFYENMKISETELIDAQWLEQGPLCSSLRFTLSVGNSQIVQNVTLGRHSRSLDFKTRVQWHERHKMLRVAFEVDVHCETANYEIQYGTVQRPTHRNTSWDKAKFEVAAHRYVDLSEKTHGVALLNDCKYGHKVLGNVLDLNLLRSPTYPDPDADRGVHEFTYSLFPHPHAFDTRILAQALQLNQAPLRLEGRVKPEIKVPAYLDTSEIVFQVCKQAQESRDLILRLYEPVGRRQRATLLLTHPHSGVTETNLLEENETSLTIRENSVLLDFAPFEIKTLKLVR